MRGVFQLGVVASLLLAFAQAPFNHAHASDPDHEHARGFAHTHWESNHDGSAWESDGHASDARMIDWLAGDGSAPAKFVPELPDSLAEVVLVRQAVQTPDLMPRNHDPPWRSIPHLRGPPA